MTEHDPETLSRQVEAHLTGHILPFWCGPALDRERGGWMAWLTNDLKPDRTRPRGLILNSRILWTFSAAHRARPATPYREMAARAGDVVLNRFWDWVHGGAFWRLNDDWSVADDSKKTYGQAFYMYALAEYNLAFHEQGALDCARELFELMERHAHDPEYGGYIEVCRRDWTEAGPDARLSEKDLQEKKSMNAHLHVLEAYTNLYRAWPDRRVADRLRELLSLFEERILDPRTQHFHHFFDETWAVRSDTYTFGHDIEGSWLLCEAAGVLGDAAMEARMRALAVRIAGTALAEGIDADHALCYEGRGGRVIDRGKEGWPQAEAMVGFVNAWQISGQPRFLEAAGRIWEYVQHHLVDPVHGDWFWRIAGDGKPDPTLPKVSEWKGPYHASRACLELSRRLNPPPVTPAGP